MYSVGLWISFGVTHILCLFWKDHWDKLLQHTSQLQQLSYNKEKPENALGGWASREGHGIHTGTSYRNRWMPVLEFVGIYNFWAHFPWNARSKVPLIATNAWLTVPLRAARSVKLYPFSLRKSSMKLAFLFLGPMALLLLVGCGCVLGTSSGNLRTFVGCAVREFTFLAKKPGCRGLRITTDACWGRCETWEVSC